MLVRDEDYQPSERAQQDFGMSEYGWIAANLYKHCNPDLEDDGLATASDMIASYRLSGGRMNAFLIGWKASIRHWQRPRFEDRGRRLGEQDALAVLDGRAGAALCYRSAHLDAWVNYGRSAQERWERAAYREAVQKVFQARGRFPGADEAPSTVYRHSLFFATQEAANQAEVIVRKDLEAEVTDCYPSNDGSSREVEVRFFTAAPLSARDQRLLQTTQPTASDFNVQDEEAAN
jgi:hypothetical protein